MARDSGRPVEVVLDDEPLPSAGPASAPAAGPASHRRPRGRRSAWFAGASVLAVVALLGGHDAYAERRESSALAAAADVPGVLGSLAEPLEEAWRLPARTALTGLGDRVVTVDDRALVGLDATTGDRRWSIPLVGGSATCPVGVPGEGTTGTLVCFGVGRPEAALGGVLAHAVDAADGRVRTELRGSRLLLAVVPLEQDAVLVGSGAGRVMVSRFDLEGGRARWAVDARFINPGVVDLLVHADPQVVALEAATTVVLDARDGRALGRWVAASDGVAPARARVVSHPGVGFGVWESRFAGRWHAPDGAPGSALDGEPLEPDVDDGSVPGLVLLRPAAGDRVRAVDVVSGEQVWDRAAPDRVLLRLGGRLVVATGGRLEAWDAATGEVRWTSALEPGEDPVLGPPLTDGVRLVLRGEGDDGVHLTALRLADGARVWRSPLPAGSESVRVLGDRVAAVGRLDDRADTVAVLS